MNISYLVNLGSLKAKVLSSIRAIPMCFSDENENHNHPSSPSHHLDRTYSSLTDNIHHLQEMNLEQDTQGFRFC